MGAAASPTKQINLERHFPQAVAEQWGIDRLAEVAKVGKNAAGSFLAAKRREARANAQRELFKISADAGAIFHNAAMRQLRRLQRLDAKPDDEWTDADVKMERHAMAMVKPLLELVKLPTLGAPDISASPRLSDGL